VPTRDFDTAVEFYGTVLDPDGNSLVLHPLRAARELRLGRRGGNCGTGIRTPTS
jgi:hypothetical protein